MKKIIFLGIGLICMVSTSFAATQLTLLKVIFVLASPIKTNTVSGQVTLAANNGAAPGWSKTGGMINQTNPSRGLSWDVPSGVNYVQPGITYTIGRSKGLTQYCNNPGGAQLLLNKTGKVATVTVWTVNGTLTCTCTGNACR